MARQKPPPAPSASWALRIVTIGFFAAQVVVVRGATSPFRLPKEAVALAALALAIGLAVASAARNRRLAIPGGRLALVLATLPVLLAVSALWASDSFRSLESAAAAAVWVAGTLWLSTVARGGRRRVVAAVGLGVACSVGVLLLQTAGVPVFEFGSQTTGRMQLTGLTGNPADLAMACVLMLPLLLTGLGNATAPSWWRALAAVLAIAAVITQTLTGIAGLLAVAAVRLIQRRSRRAVAAGLAAAVVLVAAAVITGFGQRFAEQAERLRSGDWYALLSARGDGWSAATEMVRAHPIFGVGAGNYTVSYYPSRLASLARSGGTGGRGEIASHFSWAHCDPLQLVTELGLLGVAWAAALSWALISMRRRAGPLLPLSIAAWLPFALLHYPNHLAVGLIPISIAIAELIAADGPRREVVWRRGRFPIAAVVLLLAATIAYWQVRRVAVDMWIGGNGLRLQALQSAPTETRIRGAAAIEAQIAARIDRLPLRAAELWRTVGRARLLQNDEAGAAQAFRAAHELWPHEDSEFYLGLSLAATGRRGEALQHLGRVCRTNPELATLIRDSQLRRAVEQMLESYSR